MIFSNPGQSYRKEIALVFYFDLQCSLWQYTVDADIRWGSLETRRQVTG